MLHDGKTQGQTCVCQSLGLLVNCLQITQNGSDLWLSYWVSHTHQEEVNLSLLVSDPGSSYPNISSYSWAGQDDMSGVFQQWQSFARLRQAASTAYSGNLLPGQVAAFWQPLPDQATREAFSKEPFREALKSISSHNHTVALVPKSGIRSAVEAATRRVQQAGLNEAGREGIAVAAEQQEAEEKGQRGSRGRGIMDWLRRWRRDIAEGIHRCVHSALPNVASSCCIAEQHNLRVSAMEVIIWHRP